MTWEVFITRTSMYEVEADSSERAIDIALAGDAVEISTITGDAWAEGSRFDPDPTQEVESVDPERRVR